MSHSPAPEPNGARPGDVRGDLHLGRQVYGEEARKPRTGLIVTLSVGGAVLLALVIGGAFVVTGLLSGGKVDDAADFRAKVKQVGEDHDADQCSDVDDTVLASSFSSELFPEDTQIYLCSDVDLTDPAAVSSADEDTKLLVGAYSREESDMKSPMSQTVETVSADGRSQSWALESDHWAVVGNVGTSREAKKALGGDVW